jgi:hypothetical protein
LVVEKVAKHKNVEALKTSILKNIKNKESNGKLRIRKQGRKGSKSY